MVITSPNILTHKEQAQIKQFFDDYDFFIPYKSHVCNNKVEHNNFHMFLSISAICSYQYQLKIPQN